MSEVEGQVATSSLLHRNDQYRVLSDTHHQLDDRLQELAGKPHLSETELREEATIKKRKLALKDQMEQIARDQYRVARESA